MRVMNIDLTDPDLPDASPMPLHRALWFLDVPRAALLCRLAGHDPVVDRTTDLPYLHVTCARCRTLASPAGNLNDGQWTPGDRYTGPRAELFGPRARTEAPDGSLFPGAIHTATGDLCFEFAAGTCLPPGIGVRVVAEPADGHETFTLAVRVHRLLLLSVTATGHGSGLHHRLNPTGSARRMWSLLTTRGRLWWQNGSVEVDHDEEECSGEHPGEGSIPLLPERWHKALLGEVHQQMGPVVSAEAAFLDVDGQQHPVELELRRHRIGRRMGPRLTLWAVSWTTPGIRIRPEPAPLVTTGPFVAVGDDVVSSGQWVQFATTQIGAYLESHRAEHWAGGDTTPGGE